MVGGVGEGEGGLASTCAAMHGKYSSLDSIAVMNTNLSVAEASGSFIYVIC